jgi:hypothetical protein
LGEETGVVVFADCALLDLRGAEADMPSGPLDAAVLTDVAFDAERIGSEGFSVGWLIEVDALIGGIEGAGRRSLL